jgi:hypothetical protein
MNLPRLSIARAMAIIAVLGLSAGAFVHYQRNGSHYSAGWWEAEQELWQTSATIYQLGGYRLGDICSVDQETGLPVARITGCMVEVGDEERLKGHNDHIDQYIHWHGLPSNTLKPWEQELFHLKRWFDDQSRNDRPKRLVGGTTAVIAPDGIHGVRPVQDVDLDGSPSEGLKIIVACKGVVVNQRYARVSKGESELLWGPKNAPFFVIRSVTQDCEEYCAFDSRTGRHLNTETYYQGKRFSLDDIK